jgi:hypothetical protein
MRKLRDITGVRFGKRKTKTCNECLKPNISIGQQFGKFTVIKSIKVDEKKRIQNHVGM